MTIHLLVFSMIISWFCTDFKIDAFEADNLIETLKEDI